MRVHNAIVPIENLELLKRNARYMEDEMYRRLVANIRRDGALTSVPFCAETSPGKYKVLSGNHRVQAAKDAGLTEVLIVYTDEKMTEAEMISRQLSHNAIEGKDDPLLLRELFEEINDVEWKEYTGMSDEQIRELEKLVQMTINPVGLAYSVISMLFVQSEFEHLQEVFEQIQHDLIGKDDGVYLNRMEDYNRLLTAMEEVKSAYGIRNNAVALMLVLDVYENHKDEILDYAIEERKENEWISFSLVAGTNQIPVESAKVIQRAIETMLARKEITVKNKWQAIEYMAAEYLGQ